MRSPCIFPCNILEPRRQCGHRPSSERRLRAPPRPSGRTPFHTRGRGNAHVGERRRRNTRDGRRWLSSVRHGAPIATEACCIRLCDSRSVFRSLFPETHPPPWDECDGFARIPLSPSVAQKGAARIPLICRRLLVSCLFALCSTFLFTDAKIRHSFYISKYFCNYFKLIIKIIFVPFQYLKATWPVFI